MNLKVIDYDEVAKRDLPYLKKKALHYLNLYAELVFINGSLEQRVEYIKLHFAYMEFYQGTKDRLIKKGIIGDGMGE